MADTARTKLLIIITKSNFGGAQRYVFDLSRSLKGTYDITVASGGRGLLVEKLTELGIRTVELTNLDRDVNPLKDLRTFFSLISLIRKEKPDIIHLNSSKIGIMGACATFCARSKARTIFTAHAWAFNENRSLPSKLFITFLHWLTVFLCNRTIAVSNAVRNQILHLPKMARKIEVVHLGIDKPTFYGKKNARALLGIPEKAFAVGTIAELHPIKGIEYAFEAFKHLPFAKTYTIIGQGDERQHLENILACDKALSQSVKLAGFIPDAASLLPAFDVFLLPSLSEAFGYVLLEAGYASKAVVATSVGGIPEIITDMESGILIHPKNSKEIIGALNFFHNNKKVREEYGSKLLRRVEHDFSLERMVRQTVAVYSQP